MRITGNPVVDRAILGRARRSGFARRIVPAMLSPSSIVSNGGFETWVSAHDASSWIESVGGSSTANREDADIHSGAHALRLDVDSSNSTASVTQQVICPIGDWVRIEYYAKTSVAGKSVRVDLQGQNGSTYALDTAYARYIQVIRAQTANPYISPTRSSSASSSIYFDDLVANRLILSSCVKLRSYTSDVIGRAWLSMNAIGCPAGVILCADSATNPRNFLIATHDGTTTRLEQCINGVYTTLISVAGGTSVYYDGKAIEIRKSGNQVSLWYWGMQVGTTQTIDASIVNNTLHGQFSTSETVLFNDFKIEPYSNPSMLIFDGDSMTVGPNPPTGNYPHKVQDTLSYSLNYTNAGVNGTTWVVMTANAAANVDTKYSAINLRNILVAFAGTNDIGGGADAATVYSRIVTYCQARQSVGWKVVILTLLPRNMAGFESIRDAVNASIRANWQTFASALADVGSDSIMGDEASVTNTRWYTDGLHPTPAGYTRIASVVAPEVQSLS